MVDRETQYWRTMASRHHVSRQVLRRMLHSQGFKCAVCPTMDNPEVPGKRLQLDHNHKTGKVRGFLCKRCNKRVGQIERGCGEANSKGDRYDRIPYLTYIKGSES